MFISVKIKKVKARQQKAFVDKEEL